MESIEVIYRRMRALCVSESCDYWTHVNGPWILH